MKICISGAQCVGKTTLLNSLNKVLHLPEILSPGRSIMKEMGIKSVSDMRLRGLESLFQDRVSNRVLSLHSGVKNMISDRSFFDHWGYDRVRNLSNRDYLKDMKQAKLHYDLVVCIPIEFPLINDGVRDTDDQNRIDVQDEIFASVVESELPYMTVQGSVRKRRDSVLDALMSLYDGMKTHILHNQKEVQRLVA